MSPQDYQQLFARYISSRCLAAEEKLAQEFADLDFKEDQAIWFIERINEFVDQANERYSHAE